MFQNTICTEPSVSLFDEQASDQVLRVLGDASPFVVRELVPALLNASKEQLLTGLTVLAPAPAAVGAAVPVERWIAAEQDVHDHAETPEIATLIVIIGLADESLDHLRRHKLGATDRRQKLRRSHGTRQRIVELDARTEVEVAHLDRRQFVRIHAQDILWLEISMGDSCETRAKQNGIIYDSTFNFDSIPDSHRWSETQLPFL